MYRRRGIISFYFVDDNIYHMRIDRDNLALQHILSFCSFIHFRSFFGSFQKKVCDGFVSLPMAVEGHYVLYTQVFGFDAKDVPYCARQIFFHFSLVFNSLQCQVKNHMRHLINVYNTIVHLEVALGIHMV